MSALPPPAENQAYCTVSALEAGHVGCSLALCLDTAEEEDFIHLPCLPFLLRHSVSGDTFVFDLGIHRNWENALPPLLIERIKNIFKPSVPQDASQALQKGGLEPSQIKYVCLSHLHWDHTGDTAPFTNATIIVGEGSCSLVTPGYPADPNSRFHSDILPLDRTRFLSPKDFDVAIGPFAHAHDLYRDGSLYIVDVPGHLPGHVGALVRTSSDGGWIFLAGDAAHEWRLITGEAQIADTAELGCMHQDKETAKATITKIRVLSEMPRVRVLLAHDAPWYQKNAGGNAFWPGSIESW